MFLWYQVYTCMFLISCIQKLEVRIVKTLLWKRVPITRLLTSLSEPNLVQNISYVWRSIIIMTSLQVVNGEPPKLKANHSCGRLIFSQQYVDFVNLMTTHDATMRPKYHQLLSSRFVSFMVYYSIYLLFYLFQGKKLYFKLQILYKYHNFSAQCLFNFYGIT